MYNSTGQKHLNYFHVSIFTLPSCASHTSSSELITNMLSALHFSIFICLLPMCVIGKERSNGKIVMFWAYFQNSNSNQEVTMTYISYCLKCFSDKEFRILNDDIDSNFGQKFSAYCTVHIRRQRKGC